VRAGREEGLDLPVGWFRTRFVSFDEMASLDGAVVTLRAGGPRRVPAALLPEAARALTPPAPTGRRAEDAAAFARYVGESWSPVRAARLLIDMATLAGASDVHLEPQQGGYRSRLRVGGELVDFVALSTATGARLICALKHVAGCLPYRADIVQEGRIARQGVAADLRASFLPTALGERAALRLFGQLLDLGRLGLDPAVRARFEGALSRRSGLVLVAGPSGGGKTTTLYAALAMLAGRGGGAHLSIEDPVEQRLRLAGVDVDQVELCPERGLTAQAVLVGALRQDVDVISVGEVRTAGEAALALEAAHTGRLVLAGLHAGSAREAPQRLLDLGVDPAVLRSTLQAVLHQRLEPRPCAACAGAGCAACHGLGRVRAPVAELLTQAELRSPEGPA
jgi:general secretion pathway protein E